MTLTANDQMRPRTAAMSLYGVTTWLGSLSA